MLSGEKKKKKRTCLTFRKIFLFSRIHINSLTSRRCLKALHVAWPLQPTSRSVLHSKVSALPSVLGELLTERAAGTAVSVWPEKRPLRDGRRVGFVMQPLLVLGNTTIGIQTKIHLKFLVAEGKNFS